MIVVDSSALIAIFFVEPEAEAFVRTIHAAARAHLSAASLLETAIVVDNRHWQEQLRDLDAFIRGLQIEVVPVSIEQVVIAREAHARFGKGRHPAALNFGDCFSYALAKQLDLPLLFKGNDFSRTDLRAAAPD